MPKSPYAELVEELRGPAPAAARDAARLRLLDALVAAAMGSTTDEGARGISSLVPIAASEISAPPTNEVAIFDAVATLARRIRCTEVDDIDLVSCTTPSAFVVPAALGGALLAGDQPAEQLLDAIAKGYEVGLRLAEAIGGPKALYRGIWPSIAVAAPAAAVAASTALGCDDAETIAALESAASVPPPLGRFETTAERWAAFGEAVRTGVAAAAGHARAIAAPRRADEGRFGRSLSEMTQERDAHVGGAGAIWSRSGRSRMKRWASAAQVAAAIDAAQHIVSTHGIEADEITSIAAHVPSAYVAMIDRAEVTERIASLLSAQYQLTVAVSHPEDLYDVARASLRRDASTSRLASLVTVHSTSEFDELYPVEWPARVEIVASGTRFESTSIHQSPSPSWSRAEVVDKADRLFARASLSIDAGRVADAADAFSTVADLHRRLAEVAERVNT